MLTTYCEEKRNSQHYALMSLFGGPFSKSLWDFSKWTIINVQNGFSKRLFQNGILCYYIINCRKDLKSAPAVESRYPDGY